MRLLKARETPIHSASEQEALDRFIAAAAHDFNNLLTAIRGYSELVLADIQDEELRAQLTQVIVAAERGALLADQLLVLSRNKTEK